MPCKADYLSASNREVELSKVASLLDELDGKPIDPLHWRGYHPAIYSQQVNGDALVSELCLRLHNADVSQFSLEMQIWWRDHQRADKERLEHELRRKTEDSERKAAIEKLTAYERNLLGLDD